ncbi:putative manganese-transporting ATPase PDR2 [Drosera capensis]
MVRYEVGGKVVDEVDLLTKRQWSSRLDVVPFVFGYVAVVVGAVVLGTEFALSMVLLGWVVALHVLVLLFTAWSVDFKCFALYSKVNDIHLAD